jgi:hypothetical protein
MSICNVEALKYGQAWKNEVGVDTGPEYRWQLGFCPCSDAQRPKFCTAHKNTVYSDSQSTEYLYSLGGLCRDFIARIELWYWLEE